MQTSAVDWRRRIWLAAKWAELKLSRPIIAFHDSFYGSCLSNREHCMWLHQGSHLSWRSNSCRSPITFGDNSYKAHLARKKGKMLLFLFSVGSSNWLVQYSAMTSHFCRWMFCSLIYISNHIRTLQISNQLIFSTLISDVGIPISNQLVKISILISDVNNQLAKSCLITLMLVSIFCCQLFRHL